MKMFGLANLVGEEAKKEVSVYNSIENEEERRLKELHNEVCKKLVAASEKYGISMPILVYVAISTSAHKQKVFEKGYCEFKERKVEKVMEMCKTFAKRIGEQYRTKDLLVHTACRFYDLGGTTKAFKQLVDMIDPVKFNSKKYDNAKAFANAIYGDNVEYTNGGYFKCIKGTE